jgi:hypothetical protein
MTKQKMQQPGDASGEAKGVTHGVTVLAWARADGTGPAASGGGPFFAGSVTVSDDGVASGGLGDGSVRGVGWAPAASGTASDVEWKYVPVRRAALDADAADGLGFAASEAAAPSLLLPAAQKVREAATQMGGDVDGDGRDDLVVGTGSGGSPATGGGNNLKQLGLATFEDVASSDLAAMIDSHAIFASQVAIGGGPGGVIW